MITFLQIWYGYITSEVIESEKSIRSVMIDGDTYVRIGAPKVDDPRVVSCVNRVALGAAIGNMMYVDCDYKLVARPQIPDDGLPYFVRHRQKLGGPCISLFAVNNNTEFFRQLLSEVENPVNIGSFCSILQKKSVGCIPDNCYVQPLLYTTFPT